ncbi:uncharacterized protein STEHIDRAFT_136940, partial [Stereum hirsutum FP-91666 SS1]|uniref:uncharacterized protein n=1 Tax=Stereum hirsutum (strain FP-91666) TaxID=721885 RepID=UPI000440ECC7
MSRPQTFIVFVVAVFVVNWCITLAVIMLTVWVILLRISDQKSPSESGNAQRGIASAPANSSGSLNEDEPEQATQEWRSVPLEVLSSLPLTALFSMPALRTSINYPINVASDGSGFISCIVIVAVCTALMLGMLALNLTWISLTSARKFVRTNTLQGTHLEEAHALEPLRDRRSPTTMRTSPLHM